MLRKLAIANYRSILDLAIDLQRLNIITGPNGSGKSNLYRALRLLSETAQGGVVNALAKEGGLSSTFWAGPEKISRQMKQGKVPVEGGPRQKRVRLRLGFAGEDFSYAISLGLPPSAQPPASAFGFDPEIKRESIWAGPVFRPGSLLVDRQGPLVKVRTDSSWEIAHQGISEFDSIFSQVADPRAAPEIMVMREIIRGWRFYDHFRTDHEAPARLPQLGTRTPVLHHDGRDLAAALQTIREIGDAEGMDRAVEDAFPGAQLRICVQQDGRFTLEFQQSGLLRPLSGAELSDGTLRYLCWIAALLTPRPPPLMVLNEPETSLHPDLLPALARLIAAVSERSQVWVVSHSARLITSLSEQGESAKIELKKELGQTTVIGQDLLNRPTWHWPDKV